MSDDTEFDFTGLKSLVADPTSNKTMITVLAISAIILIYTSVDLSNLNKEVSELKDSENQWQISFDLDTISFQATVILSDGEQRQFDY